MQPAGTWTKEIGGPGGNKFCEMPGEVWSIKVNSGTIVDGIQIISGNMQGQHYGGKGGKEHVWDCRHGISRILLGYGHFKGLVLVTGLCFCNGAGKLMNV